MSQSVPGLIAKTIEIVALCGLALISQSSFTQPNSAGPGQKEPLTVHRSEEQVDCDQPFSSSVKPRCFGLCRKAHKFADSFVIFFNNSASVNGDTIETQNMIVLKRRSSEPPCKLMACKKRKGATQNEVLTLSIDDATLGQIVRR